MASAFRAQREPHYSSDSFKSVKQLQGMISTSKLQKGKQEIRKSEIKMGRGDRKNEKI